MAQYFLQNKTKTKQKSKQTTVNKQNNNRIIKIMSGKPERLSLNRPAGKRSSYAPQGQRSSQTADQQTLKSRQSNIGTTTTDLESNISVYVRCRSRNDREIKENSGVVVSTMGHMGKEVILSTNVNNNNKKTYTFDRVFGAESDQEMVYEGVAKNLLDEMLQGYNCTVFAYGQTGTGKTYTMSGDISSIISENAGIIPRTLNDLFKTLSTKQEYSVKISFIELYNEELRDLLISNEGQTPIENKKVVRIFEDPNKKSIIVQGMEEIFIKNAEEGMKLLSNGSYKRQVAATQCNDLSSRSHTVFTITVHIKETDPITGEEYLKIGKLNLVDLAGSENITRSGAENKRAREAGMINQSLLTLGRVINALVDQSIHIPYRESKLTRLLQDSLGGQTKTCIIATISPAKVSLDETLSTLEYANRAKNIKNKPQVNQSMSKKLLLKEYIQEIERLRNDLNATRNKNGVYLTNENWESTLAESESRRIQVDEQKLRIDVLEDQIKKLKANFELKLQELNDIQTKLNEQFQKNESLIDDLSKTQIELKNSNKNLKIEKFVNIENENYENSILKVNKDLNDLLNDVQCEKVEILNILKTQFNLNNENHSIFENSKKQLKSSSKNISTCFTNINNELNNEILLNLKNEINNHLSIESENLALTNLKINEISQDLNNSIDKFLDQIILNNSKFNNKVEEIEIIKSFLKDSIQLKFTEIEENLNTNNNKLFKSINSLNEKISTILNDFKVEFENNFNFIKEHVDSKTNEISKLNERFLNSERKFEEMMNIEKEKLINFQKEEKLLQLKESEELRETISKLIFNLNEKRDERINNKINNDIIPNLIKIENKKRSFAENFNDFITNNWSVDQIQFLNKCEENFKNVISKISSTSVELNELIDNSIDEYKSDFGLTTTIFKSLISDLSKEINKIDEFIAELKAFNESNNLNIEIKESINLIITKTDQLSNKLSELSSIDETKMKIENILTKNKLTEINNFFKKSFNDLIDIIQTMKFNKLEKEPDLKKYKKTAKLQTTNLPTKKSRDEIIKINYEEIKSPVEAVDKSMELIANESNKENYFPQLIPDKKVKPLTTKDVNQNQNQNV